MKIPKLYTGYKKEESELYHDSIDKNLVSFKKIDKMAPSIELIQNAIFKWQINNIKGLTARERSGFQPLTIYDKEAGTQINHELEGNFVLIQNFFLGHYGHNMHDSLGMFEYMRQTFGNQVKFIITGYNNKVHKTTIEQLECVSSDYKDQIIYLPPDKVTRIKGNLILLSKSIPWHQSPKLYGKYLCNGLNELHKKNTTKKPQEKIIFCPRFNNGAKHGRCNNPDQIEKIENMLKDLASKNSTPTEVSVFIREKDDREPLTIKEQKDFFKKGTIIIGIHGTALVNMVWAERASNFSLAPLQVIECTGNTSAKKLYHPQIKPWQSGNDLGYWPEFSNNFNISWKHIFYSIIKGRNDAKLVDIPLVYLEKAIRDSFIENKNFYK